MRLLALTIAASLALGGQALAADVQVPFVGCKSDGQMGPLDPPKDDGKAPSLPAPVAAKLAWYVGTSTGGVLAPRGWRCFELYGSNGSVLMVAPMGFGRDPFTATLAGPAVEMSSSLGITSGRFQAAKLAARLFPKRKAFVEAVIAEEIEPRRSFPYGPLPSDRVERLSADAAAYTTPPNTRGLGTMGRMVKSAEAIRGLVWMDDDNDATLLAVRLSHGQDGLARAIVEAMKPR